MTEHVLAYTPPPQSQWMKRGASVCIEAQSHIDGVDHLAVAMDRKWGVDRLRLLVSAELRAKFDRQRAKFNHAVWHGDLPDLEREAARAQTAYRALDRAAVEAGAELLAPVVWEVPLPNGTVVALVRDPHEAAAVTVDGRKVEVFTLDEVARLIEGFPALVKAKQVFPGATVTVVREPVDPLTNMEFDDEIPF